MPLLTSVQKFMAQWVAAFSFPSNNFLCQFCKNKIPVGLFALVARGIDFRWTRKQFAFQTVLKYLYSSFKVKCSFAEIFVGFQYMKLNNYEREMVSHVPFLDLNTVKKVKRMAISHFILCVLMFFMPLRLPVQNAFNSCQHSTTELGQKQMLPFYDFSVVVKKKHVFFGYYRTSWYPPQK